jgi:RNase P subunit RPR2
MATSRIKRSFCLCCGSPNNSATNAKNSAPLPGDLTVCLYCGYLMRYGETLDLVAATPEDVADLDPQDRIRCLELMRKKEARQLELLKSALLDALAERPKD